MLLNTRYKSMEIIATKRANRIVKYRKLLGGFVSKNHIEVYGLSDSLVEEIKLNNVRFFKIE